MSVSLAKGQSVALATDDGRVIDHVRIALGWDAVRKGFFGGFRGADVDMDASAILYDAAGSHVDQAWFRQLRTRNDAVVHTGDNRTGAGAGDDESIIVHLDRVPADVAQIVFTINSFTGQSFAQIQNAFCRVVDESTRAEIARFDMSHSGPHTAEIMAKLSRHDGGWSMTALGEIGNGRTFQDLLPSIAPTLRAS
ncbi:tellurium resistance protein TerZ [Nocardioides luteus]|uniref:Tellurium resistance protein TerZ n=1 Tax=Nocardioides luteus TaxID=1844 RepID=A0ABQ5SU79_9ACTN|nr:TerD family protein [Nocardioides luteus]MDR7309330.1 tellurium resistance protein TerZ [Nocardioides luteus]GGR70134.1 tellurium resistance protein TerZ [Nocardioides luteus]GLJ67735.1 tellurium resistance protein TerZ [Nocardioides luteus]